MRNCNYSLFFNKKALMVLIQREWPLIFILIFAILFSSLYLYSADNITGMLHGDGYFHSIFAEKIFERESINYEWPWRLFDGLKINAKTPHYPIHYTQFYHLALGINNHILGLNPFSPFFTIFINVLLALFCHLLLREYGFIAYLIPILLLLLLSPRLLFINFMEGFLLLMFLVFLFLFKKHTQLKNAGQKTYLLAIFFLGSFIITKHLGLFDGFVIFLLLFFINLIKQNFKILILSLLVLLAVILGPLGAQWWNTGTLGYGTGTLKIPSFIPFGEQISKIFFQSKYQMPEDWEWKKLSYQKERGFQENINKISNYFTNFSYEGKNINPLFLMLIALGIFYFFKENWKVGFVIATTFIGEFFILNWQDFPLHQYNIVLNFLLVFLTIFGLYKLIFRFKPSLKLIVVTLLFLVVVINFFDIWHGKIFNNVGRKTYEAEFLYRELGKYLKENEGNFKEVRFLASDSQFGYWTKKDYMWYSELFFEELEKELKRVKEYHQLGYLIVTSTNLKNKGFYDWIPRDRYDELKNKNSVQLQKKFEIGNTWIELYKFNF